MDIDTKNTTLTPQHSTQPWQAIEYFALALATIALGFPLARILVPPFAKPGLLVPLLLVMLWIVWRATKPHRLIETPLAKPLMLVSVILAASSIFAPIASKDVISVYFHWVAVVGVLLFLTIEVLAHGWRPQIITYAALITVSIGLFYSVVVLADWWMQWIAVWQPGDMLLPVTFRRKLVNTQPNQAAMIINTGLPLAIIAFWQSKGWKWWFWAIWFFWAVVVLFHTSSRGGWLAASAATTTILIPLAWSLYRSKQWKRLRNTLLVAGFYVLFFITLFATNYHRVHELHAGRFQSSNTTTDNVNIVETVQGLAHPVGRNVFWKRALIIFQQHPILGIGPNGFQTGYKALATSPNAYLAPHAHNIYLSFLAETGILGTLALAILIITTIVVWWKGWRTTQPLSTGWLWMLGSAAVGVGLATHGMVDNPTRQAGGIVLYIMAAGLAIANCWRLSASNDSANHQTPSTGANLWQTLAQAFHRMRVPHPLHIAIAVCAFVAWGISIIVFLQKPEKEPLSLAEQQAQARHSVAINAIQTHTFQPALEFYTNTYAHTTEEQQTIALEHANLLAWQALEDPTQLPKALAAYTAYSEQFPDGEFGIYNTAMLLAEQGKEDEAIATLKSYMAEYPSDDAIPHMLLARWYEQIGNEEDARLSWEHMIHQQATLAESAACLQSSICQQMPLPEPTNETAALAHARIELHNPNAETLQTIWNLAYHWHSVNIWAVGAMAAEQAGDTHMQQRFALAARDQASMMDHKITRQLGMLMLEDAIKQQDTTAMRSLVERWLPSPNMKLAPQLSRLLTTRSDLQLAQAAYAAAQQIGDDALLVQCRHSLEEAEAAFDGIME